MDCTVCPLINLRWQHGLHQLPSRLMRLTSHAGVGHVLHQGRAWVEPAGVSAWIGLAAIKPHAEVCLGGAVTGVVALPGKMYKLARPLLAHQIFHARCRGVFVEGLSEWVVRSPGEVYQLMARGQSLVSETGRLRQEYHGIVV
eukprot:1161622-Pelagomonas_calceolata.AAC.17